MERQKTGAAQITLAAESALGALAVSSRLQCAYGGAKDLLTANLGGRWLLLPAAFAAVYLLLRYAEGKKLRRHWQTTLLAAAFAVLFVYSRTILLCGTSDFIFGGAVTMGYALCCMVGFGVVFEGALRVLLYHTGRARLSPVEGVKPLRVWAVSAAVIFVCWISWTLLTYPGTLMLDGYCQMREYFGIDAWTTHMPPFSTAIMGVCMALGAKVKSITFGAFLYNVLQTALGAAAFAYTLTLMRKMGCGKAAYLISLIFLALTPIWGAYSQWFTKDFINAAAATACVTLSLDILLSGGCGIGSAGALFILAAGAMLTRNNTVYELTPMLIIGCFCLKGADRKRMAAAAVAAFLLVTAVNKLVYPALGIEKGSIREMLSLPFQQTARYVSCHGDEVTEEERAAIAGVLSYDTLAEDYNPIISDPVKGNYHGDGAALKEYFSAWFKMFFKHPRTYFDAAVHSSYGYLAPTEAWRMADAALEEPEWLILRAEDTLDLRVGRSSDFLRRAYTLWESVPGLRMLQSPGLYFWLALACAAFLLVRKSYAALVPFAAVVMNLLVCIASPCSNEPRYCLWVLAITPMMILWTIKNITGSENKS